MTCDAGMDMVSQWLQIDSDASCADLKAGIESRPNVWRSNQDFSNMLRYGQCCAVPVGPIVGIVLGVLGGVAVVFAGFYVHFKRYGYSKPKVSQVATPVATPTPKMNTKRPTPQTPLSQIDAQNEHDQSKMMWNCVACALCLFIPFLFTEWWCSQSRYCKANWGVF
jgi:hypothetical protein